MHWREKELLEIIMAAGRLKTSDIIDRSRMCKVTALKYLNSLRVAGLINFERIGPTKLWQINQHSTPPVGEGCHSARFQTVFRMLKEFEDSTGKKAVIIMSAEDLGTNPVGLMVSLQEDGTKSLEVKTVARG